MLRRVIQIIVLLLPFLLFLIFSSCSGHDEFVVTEDINLIETVLSNKELEFIEHRRTSNQQFKPSESELKEPRFKVKKFPKINEAEGCNQVFYELEKSMRNYPLFIIDSNSNVIAYLVKFRNTTGILAANKLEIPVVLIDDFKIYFGC
tara:strand:+ start:163 stop:606 length:444 start_codon:yes stop_codon:yes gene_type:complete